MINSSIHLSNIIIFKTKTAAIVKSCLCFVSYEEKLLELERGYNTRHL